MLVSRNVFYVVSPLQSIVCLYFKPSSKQNSTVGLYHFCGHYYFKKHSIEGMGIKRAIIINILLSWAFKIVEYWSRLFSSSRFVGDKERTRALFLPHGFCISLITEHTHIYAIFRIPLTPIYGNTMFSFK